MQKLLIFSLLFLSTSASFGQKTTVKAKLTGVADRKEMIRIAIDHSMSTFDENFESTVSSSSTFPTLVPIIKIQPNGKITGNKTFWIF